MDESLYEFREARAGDLFELELCCKEFFDLIPKFQERFEHEELMVFLASYNKSLGGALVAFADPISTSTSLKPTAQIIFVFVNPTFRRKGLGKTLTRHFLKLMKRRHFAATCIELFKTNTYGIRFFESLGFKHVSEQRGKEVLQYSIWDDFGIVDESLVEE